MALILIGLVVTWTGYLKSVRSAWFIMFIIAWVWAFPLVLVGFIPDLMRIPFHELISLALRGPAGNRAWLYAVAQFTLMLIALILPVKSFFWRREPPEQSAGSSRVAAEKV
jgi:ABC-type tungstate transport system substrate-binding protein